MVEMIENIAFLQTRAASVYFLMSIFFPAPPAAALRRPVARKYCAAWDKAGADMTLCGISAPNGNVLLRANDGEAEFGRNGYVYYIF